MAVVSRKDKLLGLRSIVDGSADVVLAFVDSGQVGGRGPNAAFGLTSAVVGVGQLRGSSWLYRGGVAAMSVAAVKTVRPLAAMSEWQRSRSKAKPAPKDPAPAPTGAEARAAIRAAIPPPKPGDRIRGVRSVVSGSLGVALSLDPTLATSQRLIGRAAGVVGIVSGVRQLSSSKRLKEGVVYAHTILLPLAAVTVVGRGGTALWRRVRV